MSKLKITCVLILLFFWGGAIASQKANGYSIKRINTEELEKKIGSYELNGGWCSMPGRIAPRDIKSDCRLLIEDKCEFLKLKNKKNRWSCYYILHDAKSKFNNRPIIYDVLEIITHTPYSTNSDVVCSSLEINKTYIVGVGTWYWRKKNEGIGYGGYLKVKAAWAVDQDNKKFIELDPKKTSCELNEDTD